MPNILTLHDINYMHIIKRISFSLREKDFAVLLGHNGSGKSTLFNLLSNCITANSGQLLFQNKCVKSFKKDVLARQIVVMRQDPMRHLSASLTIYEHLQLYTMGLDIQQRKLIKDLASAKQYLHQFSAKLPDYIDSKVINLSGGEKQMLVLALNLLRQPKLLLLDEHTAALDPQTSQKIMQLTHQLIQQYGVTCIMTTHDVSLAMAYGNRLLALQEGRLLQDIPTELKRSLSRQQLMDLCYTPSAPC